MTSVLDVPALQGPPDIGAALQMLSEGLAERRARREEETKRLLAQNIGGSLAGGDFQGAADTAFATGDLSTGLKIHELSLQQKKQFAETVQRHVMVATPETWPGLRQKLTDLTGEDPGEDFEAAKADILSDYGDLDTILSANERASDNARADEQLSISQQHLQIAQDKARQEEVGGEQNLFGGNALDAQALNQLVANGTLTKQQALEVAAGKTITGPNGETIFASPSALIGGGPAAASGTAPSGMTPLTAPRFTEDMKKVAGFAKRAVASDAIISEPDITAAGQTLSEKAKSGVPVAGNYLVSENYQKFDQARRDFVNAMLRRESGAVISPDEFENANLQYFPQPGDGDAVLKQKAANRRTAIESLQQSATPVGTFPDSIAGPAKPDDVPIGVDPDLWRFLTPEERQQYHDASE